jgi:two-component system phosphate regulon response regulator PhoB
MEVQRILLVEDDPFLRRACEVGLRKRGFQVSTAVDGEEALRMIRNQAPDLVLLDLLMPKKSGVEVLEEIKKDENTRSIPVIILSNSSTHWEMDKCDSLGAAGYLVKANLSLTQLADHVDAFLEQQKAAVPG